MRNAIGYFLLFFFFVGSSNVMAQGLGQDMALPVDKKVTFQVRGGLNFSNLTASYDDDYGYDQDNADAKFGYNIGIYADIPLKNNWYMLSGLLFTSKGAKIDNAYISDFGTADLSMTAMYLQVPAYVGYKIQLPNNNLKLGLAGGLYFAYGVAGKTTAKSYSIREIEFDTFDSDGLWNKPDVGIGIEASLELENIIFVVGSEAGITKAWKRSRLSDNVYVRNSVATLSVGFKF